MAKSKRIQNGVGFMAEMPGVVSPDGKLTAAQVNYLVTGIQSLITALNGHISFGDGTNSSQSGNIDGHTKEVTFVSANTDYEVPHGLGRMPIGILLLNVNADGAVVRPSNNGSWNLERLFVRCNTAGATALFVVV